MPKYIATYWLAPMRGYIAGRGRLDIDLHHQGGACFPTVPGSVYNVDTVYVDLERRQKDEFSVLLLYEYGSIPNFALCIKHHVPARLSTKWGNRAIPPMFHLLYMHVKIG